MTNKHKGEVALQVGDATYTLRLSVNALCFLEEALDKPVNEVIDELSSGKVRMTTLRAITHAALVEQHPDIDLEAAGEIMNNVGMSSMVEKLSEALASAFPEAKVADKNPK